MNIMKKKLTGLKFSLCQMKVLPGRPDVNAAYIVDEIKDAISRGVDIIIFPEMATAGYFIGDLYEDDAFARDIVYLERSIREATAAGITAILGTLVPLQKEKGEDGRTRLLNAGVIYSNGKYVGHVAKTLQPNYRIFDDDRHFFSGRKIALEERKWPEERLEPFLLKMKDGREINLGLILCEDMWHESYPINPAKILAEKGAEIILNLSASPWTWQKNRKRHQIIKEISKESGIPFVYVNNAGIQNTGKNIILFDGSSTVYDASGDIIFQVPAYSDGSFDFEFGARMKVLARERVDDTEELYKAMRTAITEFFGGLPPEKQKMILGLSGGIDSSLSATLYADALGKNNVIGINMPSKFSSEETQNLARALADNLGIVYEVRPIQSVVDVISVASGVKEGSLAYENIQARVRMEILAARSQELGCLFSANWNKVEAAFGYGTLYGDMAGAIALIGDLVKREVYQLADYMNREVFKREVIPARCFEIAPTAELKLNQKDPFDYGGLERRGYHDEMVRSFTEFRRNPEWFLELFEKGLLEKELMLDRGRIKELFPTSRRFIYDLEKQWRAFFGAYFKRIQGPPIPIVSKRAFGTDLRESLLSPHFTKRYFELKADLLKKEPTRVAIYGGSFNPPSLHHFLITKKLLEWFDEIAIVPCGPRSNKDSLKATPNELRKEMVLLNFEGSGRVKVDAYDLDGGIFTPAYFLDEKYKKLYPKKEIWHIVGGDLIAGGGDGNSEIQKSWKYGNEIWNELNFAVVIRPGFNISPDDLPPKSEIIECENLTGSSTALRKMINKDEDASPYLKPAVYELIKKSGLYKSAGKEIL